jgi:Uma2 family endonuclease
VTAFELAPDWVCEVLSPSTMDVDRYRKLPIYRREGVGHVWLINPLSRTIEMYRREGAGWHVELHTGDRARIEPFEALELDLTELWIDLVDEPQA